MTIRFMLASALLVLLAACGGGGSSSGVDVHGTWSGSYSIQGIAGSTPVLGAIAQGGKAFFFDASGTVYELPAFEGGTQLTGTLIAYAPNGSILSNGLGKEDFELTGTASADLITGKFTGNGEMGTFTLKRASLLSGTPDFRGGDGIVLSPHPYQMNIRQQDGRYIYFIGGPSPIDCTDTGDYTQVSADTDLYTVELTGTNPPATDPCPAGTSGLLFQSNAEFSSALNVTAKVYDYVILSDSNRAFVVEAGE